MKLRSIDRLSLRMGLGVTAILIAALAAAFLLLYRQYWSLVQETARRHALAETGLVQAALRHQMLRNDRSLLREMIEDFSGRLKFERLMVLDREGRVAFSSDPAIRSSHFSFHSPTCQVCHMQPPERRAVTTTLELEQGAVLRCVRPIPNEKHCHSCHDANHRINGVLIADVSLEPVRLQIERGTMGMAAGIAGLGLFLLGGFALFFRGIVMRRLRGFERVATLIAAGQLDRRVPVRGQDALGRLERRFNEMVESVQQLVDEVHRQRALLESIINGITDGIVVLDEDLRVVVANKAFLERFGLGSSTIVGKRCCEETGHTCCGQQDLPCIARQCFERNESSVEIRTRSQGGSTIYEEVHAAPIPGEQGGKRLCVEVWRDITDRRSAEARLADYQRLVSLSALAAGFAHEMNTPLATIRIVLESVLKDILRAEPTNGKTDDLVSRLRLAVEQLDRCNSITEHFLELSRGGNPEPQWLSLRDETEKVVAVAGALARTRGVKIEVEESVAGKVFATPSAVRQVLLNLVLNAIEASGAGDVVSISSRREKDRLILSVRDNGTGIAPEDRQRIFEPFFSRREGGTGLGLFVSLSLARIWGGDITVEDNSPRGTIMSVSFPCGEDDGA